MHIVNMSTTDMQGFKKIHWKLWEELITQTLYRKAWRMDGRTDGRMDRQTDRQTDGQTGANFNAPDYRHGGIKKSYDTQVATIQTSLLIYKDWPIIKLCLAWTSGVQDIGPAFPAIWMSASLAMAAQGIN